MGAPVRYAAARLSTAQVVALRPQILALLEREWPRDRVARGVRRIWRQAGLESHGPARRGQIGSPMRPEWPLATALLASAFDAHVTRTGTEILLAHIGHGLRRRKKR